VRLDIAMDTAKTERRTATQINYRKRYSLVVAAILAGLVAALLNGLLGKSLAAWFGPVALPSELRWQSDLELLGLGLLSIVLSPLAETALFAVIALVAELRVRSSAAAMIAGAIMVLAHVPQDARWAVQVFPLECLTALGWALLGSESVLRRFGTLALIHLAHNLIAMVSLVVARL